jgi:hypothetical protein
MTKRVALARARARLRKVKVFLGRNRFDGELLKLMRVIRKNAMAVIAKVRH